MCLCVRGCVRLIFTKLMISRNKIMYKMAIKHI